MSHASRKDIRTALTLVAFICDDAALQPRLPHVVLAPRGFVLARDAPSIVARLPRNIYVVRRRSAWMDLPMMIQVIRLLGEIVQPMLHAITPVLIMDACKMQFAEPVVRACCRSCISLIIVPARMTWLLQPCDTHAFHRFKLELRSLILAERARAVNGSFGAVSFFDCLFNAVRRVLQGVSWSRAFDGDGYTCFQASTSKYVRRVLELPCQHAAPCTPLTEEDLRPIFPRGSTIPIGALLDWASVQQPQDILQLSLP